MHLSLPAELNSRGHKSFLLKTFYFIKISLFDKFFLLKMIKKKKKKLNASDPAHSEIKGKN